VTTTSWAAGQRITAGRLNALTARWAPWTPTWTTSTGAHTPSLGNATVACDWCQTGDLVTCSFDLAFGSSTTYGTSATTSDNWLFGLPVPSANATGDTFGFITLHHTDSSVLIGRVQCNSATDMRITVDSGRLDAVAVSSPNIGVVDSLTPWTWSSGDTLHGSFQYQAA
jgi:hypothetical protein